MTKKEREQIEAVDTLKQWGLVDGSTVYAKVNHVSASGMSRNISLYIAFRRSTEKTGGEIVDISYHAARALEWGYKDGYNGGVKVSGVGMDMMFHTIDALSYAMGYGAINQYNHEMHQKHNEYREDCKECRISKGAPVEPIGLKYRAL